MKSEFEVLCDDGETVVLEAETFDEAFMDALERGLKPVSVEYVS